MNDHKKAERANRDKLVSEYLDKVGATVCPPATFSDTVSAKLPTAEDRVMRSNYYASRTYRELHHLDLAACTEDGIDESQNKGASDDE